MSLLICLCGSILVQGRFLVSIDIKPEDMSGCLCGLILVLCVPPNCGSHYGAKTVFMIIGLSLGIKHTSKYLPLSILF